METKSSNDPLEGQENKEVYRRQVSNSRCLTNDWRLHLLYGLSLLFMGSLFFVRYGRISERLDVVETNLRRLSYLYEEEIKTGESKGGWPEAYGEDADRMSSGREKRATQRRRGRSGHRASRGQEFSRDQVRKWMEVFERLLQQDYHPSAHAVGEPGITTRPNIAGVPLRWSLSDDLAHNRSFTLDNYVYLTVPTDGIYFVYNQVTFHGRESGATISGYPHCAMMVKKGRSENPPSDADRVLLYGSTTQWSLGRNRSYHSAADSVYVAGIFRLAAGDALYVQLDPFSVSSRCIVMDHFGKTFFGAYRINPAPMP